MFLNYIPYDCYHVYNKLYAPNFYGLENIIIKLYTFNVIVYEIFGGGKPFNLLSIHTWYCALF